MQKTPLILSHRPAAAGSSKKHPEMENDQAAAEGFKKMTKCFQLSISSVQNVKKWQLAGIVRSNLRFDWKIPGGFGVVG